MKDFKRGLFVEEILSRALEAGKENQVVISSTPTMLYQNQKLPIQSAFKIDAGQELGELVNIEVAVNSPEIVVDIRLYDERIQPISIINEVSFKRLLQLGRGLAPGDVQPSAPGQTQDTAGKPVYNMFSLARYKDDELVDWTGDSQKWIVGRFVASIPFPYSGIAVFVKNTTDNEEKIIHHAYMTKTTYSVQPAAKIATIDKSKVTSVEVEGEEILIDTNNDDEADTTMEEFMRRAGVVPENVITAKPTIVANQANIVDTPNVRYLRKPFARYRER